MSYFTGDEYNFYTSEVMNNFYVFNNGVEVIKYWDMGSDMVRTLPGCSTYKAHVIRKYGERLCLYHTIEGGTAYPQRVRWTIVGGLTTPLATDWTNTGASAVDLDAVMGSDFIMGAEKLGNYVVIYGEDTIALQDYVGVVATPYAFYTRLTGVGMPARRGIVNLGNEHIFLGWDNVYSYKGGKTVESIGANIRDELMAVINPEYIKTCFIVHLRAAGEIRLYFPLAGSVRCNAYFSYRLINRAWSRGSRIYTGFGYYEKVEALTWDTIGDSATATWNEQLARWDDVGSSSLAPTNLYGDQDGIVYEDNETTANLVGVAIDGYWDTKDFVTGVGYRRDLTNWMELNWEARGSTIDVQYSTDFGATWSVAETYTLTSAWAMYNYDFVVNSPQIRFRFRNNVAGETFDIREIEPGYLEASDHGV